MSESNSIQVPFKANLPVAILSFVAVGLLAAIFFAPVWWVSLKAPQYPEAAFPDGIRIHFHVNGVFNGCTKIESEEQYEEEALNCKHEMDAINHYVGMYPIASGAPIERAFAPFIFTLLGVMVIAFACGNPKLRLAILGAGALGITIWMYATLYTPGGVMMQSSPYIHDTSHTMDLDPDEYVEWSGKQMVEESYLEALTRYFPNPQKDPGRIEAMGKAVDVVFGLLIGAMLLLIVGVWKSRLFYWLLALVPMALPIFFIADYAAWLWWFGHTLNEMGAFTVKPFMPTVFGQGKVAQFSTHSYPYTGFFLMLGSSLLLAVAALLRRKQTK